MASVEITEPLDTGTHEGHAAAPFSSVQRRVVATYMLWKESNQRPVK
jgi:hypothetical protein